VNGGALVIVGGGPAGLAAARSYRDAGGDMAVTMLAGERHHPYKRPPLTKDYLRGETDRSELPIESPSFFDDNDITFVPGARARALDLRARTVATEDHGDFGYWACVLATGSEPFRLPIPGADDPNLYVMRTIEDSDRLAAAAVAGARAVVVGSGFIGCEAAASLAMRGAEVTLVSDEAVPQERRLGDEAGSRIGTWLEELGVTLKMGAGVAGIEARGGGHSVTVEGGESVSGDIVFLGTGVRARVGLAEAAGLPIANGGVVTDSSMHTGADDIWAAGDITFAMNAAAGRRLRVEHWGEALNQGTVAGKAITGADARWDIAPGFWSTIGTKTLKHVAWGDGHDEVRVEEDGDGWSVWYGSRGVTVGVLTHNSDDDHDRGRKLVETKGPLP